VMVSGYMMLGNATRSYNGLRYITSSVIVGS